VCTTDKETRASRVLQGTTIADWEVLERLAGVDSARPKFVGANAAVFRARCVLRRCVEAQLPEYALKVMFRPAAEECHPSFFDIDSIGLSGLWSGWCYDALLWCVKR
jgi:hypothetical protein